MREYQVTFARSARKELESFDASTVNSLFPKIELLARAPRPRGSRKLRGENGSSHISVRGTQSCMRLMTKAACQGLLIDVINEHISIRHRKDAYR